MKTLIPQTVVETISPNTVRLRNSFVEASSFLGRGSRAAVRLRVDRQLVLPPPCFSCSRSFSTLLSPVCLIYWGDNVQCFGFVFEPYGVIHLPTQLLYKEKAQQRNCHGCGVFEFLLGGIKYSPSNQSKQIGILPKLDSPSTTTPLSHIQNSNSSPCKKCRNWGEGNGTIHWRTITKNGKDYPQAYYHWKENGRKRTKYIPKQLLGVIQEAEEQKRPVIEILKLLGVVPQGSSEELLVGIENRPSNDEEQLLAPTSKNSPSNNAQNSEISTSKNSFSKTRRNKGLGTGDIQWKTITLNGKDYPQAWYHYEEWKNGERLVKKSKYIPKRLLTRIQELEAEKAPVKEILKLLRVKL